MRMKSTTESNNLADVFVLELDDGSLVECVESTQPPLPRSQKWVLIVSTLKGCPVGCPICDAGASYAGKLTAKEILRQIDFLVTRRFPDRFVPVSKFKIQFARMGEPALNGAVLDVLCKLPLLYQAPGLMPCLSTIAPSGHNHFFEQLLEIKNAHFANANFQFQFSLHTTDEAQRDQMIPVRTWSFEQMADYGARFVSKADRKIALNFALPKHLPFEPKQVAKYFSPDYFLVKLTPINPTINAKQSGWEGLIDPSDVPGAEAVAEDFRALGFETILSIGEPEENKIGSNCGMLVKQRQQKRLSSQNSIQQRLSGIV